MIKSILMSFSQGFFKTIGKVLAWVVLALLVAYLYNNGLLGVVR